MPRPLRPSSVWRTLCVPGQAAGMGQVPLLPALLWERANRCHNVPSPDASLLVSCCSSGTGFCWRQCRSMVRRAFLSVSWAVCSASWCGTTTRTWNRGSSFWSPCCCVLHAPRRQVRVRDGLHPDQPGPRAVPLPPQAAPRRPGGVRLGEGPHRPGDDHQGQRAAGGGRRGGAGHRPRPAWGLVCVGFRVVLLQTTAAGSQPEETRCSSMCANVCKKCNRFVLGCVLCAVKCCAVVWSRILFKDPIC